MTAKYRTQLRDQAYLIEALKAENLALMARLRALSAASPQHDPACDEPIKAAIEDHAESICAAIVASGKT